MKTNAVETPLPLTDNGLGCIILTGGKSRRMGVEKYRLRIGEETVLERICRIAATQASEIVIVASTGQDFSDLAFADIPVSVCRDKIPGEGPLPAVVQGLRSLHQRAPELKMAFVLSCDVPLITEAVMTLLATRLKESEADCVIVNDGERDHPLCGVWRLSTVSSGLRLVEAGVRRMTEWCQQLLTARLLPHDLAEIDPQLGCLLNMNTPDDY
ncbi:MAG: molybdenum cofactor guanylyltransferase, partial [Planctomycetaceae bacterium]|nr:molybdenum cofactor guanylyltransferase [Planctomycetaceae bacterium]